MATAADKRSTTRWDPQNYGWLAAAAERLGCGVGTVVQAVVTAARLADEAGQAASTQGNGGGVAGLREAVTTGYGGRGPWQGAQLTEEVVLSPADVERLLSVVGSLSPEQQRALGVLVVPNAYDERLPDTITNTRTGEVLEAVPVSTFPSKPVPDQMKALEESLSPARVEAAVAASASAGTVPAVAAPAPRPGAATARKVSRLDVVVARILEPGAGQIPPAALVAARRKIKAGEVEVSGRGSHELTPEMQVGAGEVIVK